MEFLSWLFDRHYVLAVLFLPVWTLCWAYFHTQKLKLIAACAVVAIKWGWWILKKLPDAVPFGKGGATNVRTDIKRSVGNS